MSKENEVFINITAKSDVEKAFEKTQKEIDKLSRKLERERRKIEREIRKIEREQQRALRSIENFSKKSLIAVSAAVLGAVKVYADYEQAVAGVVKTAQVADSEVAKFTKNLEKSINDLAKEIPTQTPVGLLNIAKIAAQLGVQGVSNIAKFTGVIAKLEASTDLVGEGAALNLARIISLTGENVENIDRLGAAIVELGNNFAVTEKEIVANAVSIAQATSQYKIGTQTVLGFATAFRAVGVESEISGSTIAKIFLRVNEALAEGGDRLKVLRDITGLTRMELVELFAEDPAQGLQLFIESLGDVEKTGMSLNEALKELRLSDIRLLKSIPALVENYDLLEDALNRSNAEYEKAAALEKEFDRQTETLTNRFKAFINSLLLASKTFATNFTPSIKDALVSLTNFLNSLSQETINKIADLTKLIISGTGLIVAVRTLNKVLVGIVGIVTSLGTAFKASSVSAKIFWNGLTGPVVLAVASFKALDGALKALGRTLLDNAESEKKLISTRKELRDLSIQLAQLEVKRQERGLNTLEEKLAADVRKEIEERKSLIKVLEQEVSAREQNRLKKEEEIEVERDLTVTADDSGAQDEINRALQVEREKQMALDEFLAQKREEKIALGFEEREADKLLKEQYTDEDLELLKSQLQTQEQINDNFRKSELSSEAKFYNERLKREKEFGKTRARLDADINKTVSDGAFATASLLVSVSGASAKAQIALQKALGIAQVLINGQIAASLAVATIPPPAGEAVAASRITQSQIQAAFIAAQGLIEIATLQQGGIVPGTGRGDKVPALLEPGELVVPAPQVPSFLDVVSRQQTNNMGEDDGVQPQNIQVEIGLTDEAKEIGFEVTQVQFVNQQLGIDR